MQRGTERHREAQTDTERDAEALDRRMQPRHLGASAPRHLDTSAPRHLGTKGITNLDDQAEPNIIRNKIFESTPKLETKHNNL